MLPAATSCSSGFHRCERILSIKVTAALPRLPNLLPSRVTSSKPPAPPPTTTILCSAPAAGMDMCRSLLLHDKWSGHQQGPAPRTSCKCTMGGSSACGDAGLELGDNIRGTEQGNLCRIVTEHIGEDLVSVL